MARGALLTSRVRRRVTHGVGMMLPHPGAAGDDATKGLKLLAESALESQLAMGSTFEVWSLRLDRVVDHGDDLRTLAASNGRWHHQLIRNGDAVAFARSTSGEGPAQGSVTATFVSPLAASIDAVSDVIDEAFPSDDVEVRLLVVPALSVNAMWVLPPDPFEDTLVLVAARGPLRGDPVSLVFPRQFMEHVRGLLALD